MRGCLLHLFIPRFVFFVPMCSVIMITMMITRDVLCVFKRVFHNTNTLDSSPLNWERETQPSTNVKVLHDMPLPCHCFSNGYLLIMATMRHELVSIAAMKTTAEHVHSSSQIYREKRPEMLCRGLWACHGGSHFFCGTIAFRCGQTARSPDAKKRKKENTRFLKMKCFERNELRGESPVVETSNINSQRESSVGDENQFHEVWSFPSAETTEYRADERPVRQNVHMQYSAKQTLLVIKIALILNLCPDYT